MYLQHVEHQWIEIDVGPPTLITGILTKGRADSKKQHWVTRFKITYSNDSQVWYQYKDAHNAEPRVSLCVYLTHVIRPNAY